MPVPDVDVEPAVDAAEERKRQPLVTPKVADTPEPNTSSAPEGALLEVSYGDLTSRSATTIGYWGGTGIRGRRWRRFTTRAGVAVICSAVMPLGQAPTRPPFHEWRAPGTMWGTRKRGKSSSDSSSSSLLLLLLLLVVVTVVAL